MIDDYMVSFLETLNAAAGLDYLSAWLMPGDNTLVCLGTFPQVFTVDRPYIAAAD